MPGPYVGNPFAQRFGDYFQAAANDPALRHVPGGYVQYAWANINEARIPGEPLPPGAFAAVSQLVGLAVTQREAAARLAEGVARQQAGPFDVSIESNMIAPHLDTRALNEMVLGPQHRVVYLTEDLVEGEPVLSYKTHDFGYNLPQSIAQLNAEVEDAAQLTAADYGFEWGGVATPVGIYSY